MSDDRSDRSPALTRRQMLAITGSAGAAGIAGCVGTGSDSTPGGDGTQTTGSDGTTTGTTTGPGGTTTTGADSLYSGKTIPPTNYEGMTNRPPTVAAPASEVDNPVLSGEDVTDFGKVDYVADPFLFVEDGTWHLFFEVVNTNRTPDAVIGHATSSDGLDWNYQGVVVEKGSHTSYPMIWKWQGEYYMAPADGKAVQLWQATEFPSKWEKLGTVIEEDYFTHDPVFVRYDDRWWLFTSRENEDLMVFHADELSGSAADWTPHANNPVVTDRKRAARQGGRPVVVGDDLYLFFQDLEYEYGDQVRSFRVTDLTPDSYSDEEVAHSPVLTGFGSGWNSRKMHHFDPWSLGEGNGWRCSVDGAHGPSGNKATWGIGIYDVPNIRDPDPSAIPYKPDRTTGFYRFDGKSQVAVDDSGNANHGMIRGTKTTTVGGCPGRRFAKDSDRMVIPTTMKTMGSDAFTLFFRGKLRNPDTPQALFTYTSRHVNRRLAVRYTPDGPGWELDLHGTEDRVRPTVKAPISADKPFELALSYKRGDGYRIVQDGKELTTARDVGDAFHEVCVPVVGSTLPGQLSWEGDVSHVGIFDDALGPKTLSGFSLCSSK